MVSRLIQTIKNGRREDPKKYVPDTQPVTLCYCVFNINDKWQNNCRSDDQQPLAQKPVLTG